MIDFYLIVMSLLYFKRYACQCPIEPPYLNSMVISGMVRIDATVVMNVISVISAGLRPYFMQNIVPKDATGMAMTTVLMSLMASLTPHTLKRKYSETGTTTSLTADDT